MMSNSQETSVAVINEIKELCRAKKDVPLELMKDMTINQFRNMMDELDEEKNKHDRVKKLLNDAEQLKNDIDNVWNDDEDA